MQLLEPWVFLRVIAGIVATALLLRASFTAINVLRRFDVMKANEGQLALERRVELAAMFVRVGAIAQVAALVLTVLAADRLSRGIRGAMCAYGAFSSSPWGFRALVASSIAALAAGTVAQLFVLDSRTRGMELTRTLSLATLLLAPFAVVDLVLTLTFTLDLDLSVVASCCSVQLDPLAAARQGTASGPRVIVVALASIAWAMCVVLAIVTSRRPKRSLAALNGALATLALPLGVGAVMLHVAPYALEQPQHHCPFCLLRSDTAGIGYPLFGAMLIGAIWLFGAGLSALVSRAPEPHGEREPRGDREAHDVWAAFARSRLRRGAIAWVVCGALCAVPIVRYAILSSGRPLFP